MSVYMCVLQSIASNSQREFNLSAAGTPVPHSGRILVKDALIATMLRKLLPNKDTVFHIHTLFACLCSLLDLIIIPLNRNKNREDKKEEK